MPWEMSDPYGVEDELEAMGPVVWNVWLREVRPRFLEDPSPTNPDLHITQTDTTQLWIGDTDVYVLIFPTDDDHVMLIKAVKLLDELS
ncbi:MAG TPA: hypothetical protein VJA46_09100 [Acidimicrobiia bacterium]|nr:hypothetical protein [Acidimicrobiia bacterium]